MTIWSYFSVLILMTLSDAVKSVFYVWLIILIEFTSSTYWFEIMVYLKIMMPWLHDSSSVYNVLLVCGRRFPLQLGGMLVCFVFKLPVTIIGPILVHLIIKAKQDCRVSPGLGTLISIKIFVYVLLLKHIRSCTHKIGIMSVSSLNLWPWSGP